MRSLLAFLLVAVATADVRDVRDVCGSAASVSDKDFQALFQAVKQADFEDDRLKVVSNFVANATLGFTGNQTASILELFNFADGQIRALALLGDHLLSLTCADVVSVLEVFSFSADQLAALTVLIEYTIRSDISLNNATIISSSPSLRTWKVHAKSSRVLMAYRALLGASHRSKSSL